MFLSVFFFFFMVVVCCLMVLMVVFAGFSGGFEWLYEALMVSGWL